MPQNKRDEIVKYLTQCSLVELREILSAVFKTRRPNPEEDKYNKNCFFLGTASSLLESSEGEAERWGTCEIAAVANVDKEVYGEDVLGIDWGSVSLVRVLHVESEYAQT